MSRWGDPKAYGEPPEVCTLRTMYQPQKSKYYCVYIQWTVLYMIDIIVFITITH